MNAIVNKLLVVEDKFMPEMYLRQPGFTYSVCVPFIKNEKRIKKFKATGDSGYIYQNELDKAFKVAINSKYDAYKCVLGLVVYKCFDIKTSGGTVKNKNVSNKELSELIHKLIIRNFEKRKVQ